MKRVIIAAIVVVAAFVMMSGFVLWWLALILLATWTPWLWRRFHLEYTRSPALGLLFALLIMQSIHAAEHLAQEVQIHLMGWPFPISHGILGGQIDTEWFHFLFDTLLIPYCVIVLIPALPKCVWLWLLLPLAIWHGIEHVAIMNSFLVTHRFGAPGILAEGGLIGLPIARPDLHFLYNMAEVALIGAAYCRNHTRDAPCIETVALPVSLTRLPALLGRAYRARASRNAILRAFSIERIFIRRN